MSWLGKNIGLSPPDYFKIIHEGNARQKRSCQPNLKRAVEQWWNLDQVYIELGVVPKIIPSHKNCSELCFVGDSVFIHNKSRFCPGSNIIFASCFSSRVRFARSSETGVVAKWLLRQGGLNINRKLIYRFPRSLQIIFEGRGEALCWGEDIIFLGYGVRGNGLMAFHLQKLLDVTVIPLHLKEPFFHLDLALFPLDEKCVLFCPDGFEKRSWKVLEKIVPKLETVSKKEAWKRGGLNAERIGKTVVMPSEAQEVPNIIRGKGYGVRLVDVSEFFQIAAGGIKCLTLRF